MKKLLIFLTLIFIVSCGNNTIINKNTAIKKDDSITKITDITIATVEKTIDMNLFRKRFSEKLNNILQEKLKENNEYIDLSVIIEDNLKTKEDFYRKTKEEFLKRKLEVEYAESFANEIFSEILLDFLKEEIYSIMVQKNDSEKEFLGLYILPDNTFKEFYIFTAYGDYI
jgi:translation elongation factor EF-G